ncbi:MAG: hypothetical protein ACXW61_02920 [Gemmatirosa sp.]
MYPERLALYTTIHPVAMPYVDAWYRSVRAQTDQRFDLWIAIDGVTADDVASAVGEQPDATWVVALPGDTPASLRGEAMRQMVERHDAVVFTDADDVLTPDRVAAAREALGWCDVAACALQLVDDAGADLGAVLAPPPRRLPAAMLPRWNVFGLSNTAYRASTLRRCLPIPRETVLIDWYLATMAWTHGARLSFDPQVHMLYRRHGSNAAPILPPYAASDVRTATDLTLGHFEVVLRTLEAPTERRARLAAAQTRVRTFRDTVLRSPTALDAYTQALNDVTPPVFAWWACVAHPELEAMWTSSN